MQFPFSSVLYLQLILGTTQASLSLRHIFRSTQTGMKPLSLSTYDPEQTYVTVSSHYLITIVIIYWPMYGPHLYFEFPVNSDLILLLSISLALSVVPGT